MHSIVALESVLGGEVTSQESNNVLLPVLRTGEGEEKISWLSLAFFFADGEDDNAGGGDTMFTTSTLGRLWGLLVDLVGVFIPLVEGEEGGVWKLIFL